MQQEHPKKKYKRSSKSKMDDPRAEKTLQAKKELWFSNKATGWKSASLIKEYRHARKLVSKKVTKSIREYELELANDKKNP